MSEKITQDRIQEVHAFIEEVREEPLKWGVHDCCIMCAAAAMDLFGHKDLMKQWRGKYSSKEEAIRIMAKAGGLQKLIEKVLGPMLPPEKLRIGDIAFGDFGDGDSVALCTGHNVAAVGRRGLVFAKLGVVKGCWRL